MTTTKFAGAAWSFVGASLSESAAIWQALGIGAMDLMAVPGGLLDSREIERDPEGQARRVTEAGLPLSNLLYIFGDGFDDRPVNSVDGLHSIIGLTTDLRESLLYHPLDLTQIGRLTHEAGSVPELRKPCLIMRDEIIENRLIHVEAQILATHLKRDYLLIAERRRKTASAQRAVGDDRSILLTYQTVDIDDKMVPIHRLLSSL